LSIDYSIIIPVFNKARFTKQCLDTLRPTLEGAGEGEVIVIDNASSDETPALLSEYPWVRVIRNEKNLGFAGANNQGARLARGEFLVLLNNDTQALPGWLAAMIKTAREPGVGAVGAKLLFADRTVQHGGVVINGVVLGRSSMMPFHHNLLVAADRPDTNVRRELQAVTGACIVTPRELYQELGGLDELYWNGYEDVDYCFKVRERGLRVVYEPAATLYHFESQSGIQRFRKATWNEEILEERWRGTVRYDAPEASMGAGLIRRLVRTPRGGYQAQVFSVPTTTVVVHGEPDSGREAFEQLVRRTVVPIDRVLFAVDDPVSLVRDEMELRGHRYLAVVNAQTRLEPRWLEALVAQVESIGGCAAATAAPELPIGENVATLAADARCTLLSLFWFPQHLRLRDFATLDGAIADLLLRVLELERGTRGVSRHIATLSPPVEDESFERAHGIRLRDVFNCDSSEIERRLGKREKRSRGLVSIITLSWNAVEYTKIALDSIRQYTSEPYEVIVVDNGSREDTIAHLRTIQDPHVRVIYNPTNLGYAGGNNVGIAAALGEYVVLLNNDVIVTDGWIDGLLDPFRRNRGLGVTAPRSNRVAGDQQVSDAQYNDANGIQEYARARRAAWKRSGYTTERAIGLCLCIDRKVIDEVGGLDEQFGLGNFEDDDFCIRVRAAGYGIYVCDDVFIHHFGSRSFAANNVDYAASMQKNWSRFAAKWGYGALDPVKGYDPRAASSAGFRRAAHYVALPNAPEKPAATIVPAPVDAEAQVAFFVSVRNEAEWRDAAEFVKRFARAYRDDDPVILAIASLGEPYAQTIGERVERLLRKADIDPELTALIDISDEDDENAWRNALRAQHIIDVRGLTERSPSSLRRLLNASVA